MSHVRKTLSLFLCLSIFTAGITQANVSLRTWDGQRGYTTAQNERSTPAPFIPIEDPEFGDPEFDWIWAAWGLLWAAGVGSISIKLLLKRERSMDYNGDSLPDYYPSDFIGPIPPGSQ